MKRFLKKIGCGKSPEPLELPIPLRKSTSIAATPPDHRTEPNVIPDGEGGGENSQIPLEDGMDANQRLLVPRTSTSCVAISGTDYRNQPTTESASDTEEETGATDASVVVEKASAKTSIRVAKSDTEKFGPLKAALGNIPAICANHTETVAVGNKISNLLSRIVALEDCFDSPPSGVPEQRHRVDLICKLDAIEKQLRLISEKSGLLLPADHVQASEDTFLLLEDIQEATLDYQTTQQTTYNNQGLREIDPAEAAVLNSVRCAQQAGYRHGNRSGCLRGTRTALVDDIELWTRDFDKPPVYWLNGLAGTGKSTIAQTIAERTFADGRLGASFFCSRDFEDRRNLQSIFPTLAVQLARRYSEFRSTFIRLVRSDPEIVHESLYNQMKNLIVQPLVESSISTVIVIDALDECKDEEPASAILSVLGQFVEKVPMVKFFITGRPESRIREGFRLPLLAKATDVFILHEVEPDQVDNDIRRFFGHNFSELKTRRHGLDGWPTEEQLDLLCERAGGLFVYAMATVRFIDQRNSSPKKQLDRLLQSQSSSVFEGKTKFRANMNTTLDSLYTSILQEAFSDDDPENDSRIRSILGAVVLATNPLSPSAIAALLGFESEEVFPILSSMRSLLVLREDIDQPVRTFHKSFPDFIVDPARCLTSRFRVCPPDQHTELLVGSLETMNRELEWNICKLPDGVVNSEVIDLRERTNEHVSQVLEYACRSWYKHLVGTRPARITPILRQFLEEKFLFWLEVLSILGAAKEAVHALEATEKCEWVENQTPSTLDLVRDYSRFIITFFEVINLSAPHIYHSALPLSPQTSIIRELYEQYTRPLARVVRGLPSSWDATAAILYSEIIPHSAIWSPCNKVIAIVGGSSVATLDATTLSRLDTFAIPSQPHNDESWLPSFSLDGHCLTLIGRGQLISWDLQTGGPLDAIPSGLERDANTEAFSFTYSEDGKVVAAAYSDWSRRGHNAFDQCDTFIRTYDLSGTEPGRHCAPKGRIIEPIWTHEKCIRFVTINPGSVVVSEVEFTLKNPPVEVESLPIADKIVDGSSFLFLPSLSRLAFSLKDSIQVWDAKAAKLLLKFEALTNYCIINRPIGSFSSDGRFFVHVGINGPACVRKETPAGYVLHHKLPFCTAMELRLSSSGESILLSRGFALHLWHTRDQVPSLPSVSAGDVYMKDFTLAFSPDERFAAFARQGGNAVTILNTLTGDLQFAVDTDVGVACLGITGSTLIVFGEEKIITWDLPGGDCAFNASIDDSVRTTVLCPSQSGFKHVSISPDSSRIAFLSQPKLFYHLQIYDTSTGRCLTSAQLYFAAWVGFARDGREVWTTSYNLDDKKGWKIVEDSVSGPIRLEPWDGIVPPSGVFPWESHRGYEVADDGWVLSATQKRLLWLPHRWRSEMWQRVWSGQFLGLLQSELSDIVILEFPE